MDGVVLAGGASRRMGVDKATLVVGGERLVDAAVAALAGVCGQVVVASGGRTIDRLEVTQVADAVPGVGPLGGIVAGLAAVTATLVAVVAVDQPAVSAAVLRALADAWDGRTPAVVPIVGGRLQPLHAVYARAAHADLQAALAAGERSPTAVLERLGCQVAGPEVWAGSDPEAAFSRDLDRPEDLS